MLHPQKLPLCVRVVRDVDKLVHVGRVDLFIFPGESKELPGRKSEAPSDVFAGCFTSYSHFHRTATELGALNLLRTLLFSVQGREYDKGMLY